MSAWASGPTRSWSGASRIPRSRSIGPSDPSGSRLDGRPVAFPLQVHRDNKLRTVPRNRTMEPWDVTIVGGGILGTSFAYWLANRYDGCIAVLEKESQVAMHTSRRNNGVVHQPIYLDPVGRKVFARVAQTAYGMWKTFAAERGLTWLPVGTFEVAVRPDQVSRLEKYRDWGLANGMGEDELALLTAEDVRRLEPNVRSHGAIWSKTDTSVDYQAFTQALRDDAERAGARFLLGADLESIDVADDHLEAHIAPAAGEDRVYVDPRSRIRVSVGTWGEPLLTKFLINAAGGNSIDIAHALGVAREYTDLHFRGEYWEVDPARYYLSSRNLYTVPRHPELPFLDPHWIVRADGRRSATATGTSSKKQSRSPDLIRSTSRTTTRPGRPARPRTRHGS